MNPQDQMDIITEIVRQLHTFVDGEMLQQEMCSVFESQLNQIFPKLPDSASYLLIECRDKLYSIDDNKSYLQTTLFKLANTIAPFTGIKSVSQLFLVEWPCYIFLIKENPLTKDYDWAAIDHRIATLLPISESCSDQTNLRLFLIKFQHLLNYIQLRLIKEPSVPIGYVSDRIQEMNSLLS